MTKKVFLLLVVLALAAPAMAHVMLSAVDDGDLVAINYTSDANVSAFALKISVGTGTITGISNYFVGECNSTAKGYGIFLDKVKGIDIDPDTGLVNSYGSPVIDVNSPDGTGTGIGTNQIIIEMGALYEDGNQPAKSGTLCKLSLSNCAKVTVSANATRGGVVLEDATTADTNLPFTTDANIGPCAPPCTGCFPCTGPPDPNYLKQRADYDAYIAAGRAVGDMNCWCAYPIGSGYQCYGDANGGTEGLSKYRVYTSDITIVSSNWKKKITDLTLNPCADIDHKSEGLSKYRVYSNDVTVISSHWKAKDTALTRDCPRPD